MSGFNGVQETVARRSGSFPTVEDLKQALRKCGLEDTADFIIISLQ